MHFTNATRSQRAVIVVNGIIRLIQMGVGVLTIDLYEREKGYWLADDISSKLTYELVLGPFAVVTGLICAIVPLQISYRPVALACPWDLVMFFMYSAAFGYMRAIDGKLGHQPFRTKDPDNTELFFSHASAMMHKVWVNLAGMAVFLTSGVMGAVLIWIGRRNGRGTKHSAV
ncbi:hypothetical protein AYL99_05397 [Fonsecaea erecta]|uniref:MARVEL domain-containing protein n=1 Tax=Fonsecaea erecta TaxID=1367422 RepID=A0A178ZMZ6_9EURO|nr:hypothetical protein AYL99_05397 [Fonsecaea erecta]OAP60395.1 hypothetical protein AYL99_05397 [Fonsecaea erecta]